MCKHTRNNYNQPPYINLKKLFYNISTLIHIRGRVLINSLEDNFIHDQKHKTPQTPQSRRRLMRRFHIHAY